jgi:hypothetical protein
LKPLFPSHDRGKLATGAQAERGATMRTALASNPYAGAVMQAPSISF